jgi:hypothetical protein
VPVEVIEWQPAIHQRGAAGLSGGAWQACWEVTQSSKCRYLISRLRELSAIPEPQTHADAASELVASQEGSATLEDDAPPLPAAAPSAPKATAPAATAAVLHAMPPHRQATTAPFHATSAVDPSEPSSSTACAHGEGAACSCRGECTAAPLARRKVVTFQDGPPKPQTPRPLGRARGILKRPEHQRRFLEPPPTVGTIDAPCPRPRSSLRRAIRIGTERAFGALAQIDGLGVAARRRCASVNSGARDPPKVIIYTSFWVHFMLIRRQLQEAGARFVVSTLLHAWD